MILRRVVYEKYNLGKGKQINMPSKNGNFQNYN